jgi:23S rRNA pseudouridine1911/1915/1917 synthase
MNENYTFSVEASQRLDAFLASTLQAQLGEQFSRSRVQELIRSGHVFVNHKKIEKVSYALNPGDSVLLADISALPERVASPTPFEFALDCIFEDEHILVINKPAGISVHPGAGNANTTLLNALVFRQAFSSEAGFLNEGRLGIVHRLDKDTSGLLVVAKTQAALTILSRQFEKKTAGRQYLAMVVRSPRGGGYFDLAEDGTIDACISRDPRHRLKMKVSDENGRKAITHWHIEKRLKNANLIDFRLETGRTHQIRVHAAHLGAPLLGDPLYGEDDKLPRDLQKKVSAFGRQALHAYALEFTHPGDGTKKKFFAPIPEDFRTLLADFEISEVE